MLKNIVVIVAGIVALAVITAVMISQGRKPEAPSRITFTAPTPAPVEIFWIDTAGNIGMRGAVAVVPGAPDEKSKIPDSCRTSATANGNGTLTVCLEPVVGQTLRKELGFD